jgi:hypothetical protein
MVRKVRVRTVNKKLIACIPACFLAFQMAAAAPEKPSIRDMLGRILDKGAAAFQKGTEMEFMKSIMTTDYTVTAPNGVTMSREQVLAQMKAQQAVSKRPSVKTVINRFELGEGYVVTKVTTLFSVTYVDTHGELGAVGKKHLLEKSVDSRITWVKTSSGWKMKHSLRSPDRRYVDGKRNSRPRFDD